ncbi:MAG: hypothetical protein HRU09_20495 [Oligoflexales bacterium]|nr:hypothetical protein [Oligoflexales bacterium]
MKKALLITCFFAIASCGKLNPFAKKKKSSDSPAPPPTTEEMPLEEIPEDEYIKEIVKTEVEELIKAEVHEITKTTVEEASNQQLQELAAEVEELKEQLASHEADQSADEGLGLSEPASEINGVYHSKKWGLMVIKIDVNNDFRAVYEHKMGTLTGKYDPAGGLIVAYWCEEPDREKYQGYAEFYIMGAGQMESHWEVKSKGKGKAKDWELEESDEDPASKPLVDFSEEDKFCYPELSIKSKKGKKI